jgi:hypothetical protein
MHSIAPEVTVFAFLKQLRARGPWVLTAIEPDGMIQTRTVDGEAKVAAFVRQYNGQRNLYYSVNPTRGNLVKKATKADISRIEWLFADLDPAADEPAEIAKERYLEALQAMRPTAAIDSGNGIQVLYRLEVPIVPSAAAIADVEARTRALIERLGAKAGTQNIDRILRLPGTVNLPNAKKRKDGRMPCGTELLWFDDARFALEAFPLPQEAAPARRQRLQRRPAPKAPAQARSGDEDALRAAIRDGQGHGVSRSEAVWFVVHEMLRRGYAPERVEAVLLDDRNGVSAHVREHPEGAQAYARRQVNQALGELQFVCKADKKGKPTGEPLGSVDNINIGLHKLGVRLSYNEFADQILIKGLPGFGPILEDAAVDRLWLTLGRQFKLDVRQGLLFTVVKDTARLNSFHPVRDYLDGLQWDGVKRLDYWLRDYAHAVDSEYTRAVGALLLTAAVRRVRQPGCKFDEMVVLEDPVQGSLKSTALEVLAVRAEWFADDLPLSANGKEVIELLRGKWIVEAAELSGLRRAEVQHIKALLSRRFDRGRMAYDRTTSEVPRQCVICGTTNDSEYLKDTTGNRRFWPVRTNWFDVEALKGNVAQLWAEAAAREASGVGIRLPEKLWPIAAKHQERRLTKDPYGETLSHYLTGYEGKIASEDVWTILDVKPGARWQELSRRMGDAMRALGWQRANSASLIKIEGKLVVGWVKGKQPWGRVLVSRDGSSVSVSGGTVPEVSAPVRSLWQPRR